MIIFFFQAEDGIRDGHVTGVKTCALPIWGCEKIMFRKPTWKKEAEKLLENILDLQTEWTRMQKIMNQSIEPSESGDRKSTRLNSSHVAISYAVFCLKKKRRDTRQDDSIAR